MKVAIIVALCFLASSVSAEYYFLGHYTGTGCAAANLDQIVFTFSSNCNSIPYGAVKVQTDGSVIIYAGALNNCDGVALATATKTCNGNWKIIGTADGSIGKLPNGAMSGSVNTALYTSACSSSSTTQTYTSGVISKASACVPSGQSNVYTMPSCSGSNSTLTFYTTTDCTGAVAATSNFPSVCAQINGKAVQGGCKEYSSIQGAKSSSASLVPMVFAIIATAAFALFAL